MEIHVVVLGNPRWKYVIYHQVPITYVIIVYGYKYIIGLAN